MTALALWARNSNERLRSFKEARAARDAALLGVRIALAWIFVYHGAGTLFGAFGGAGVHAQAVYFAHVAHLQPATFFAVLGGIIECFGGAAIGVGILGRFAALCVFGDMVAAMVTVTFRHGIVGDVSGSGYELNVALAALALVVVILGTGRLSLDAALRWAYAAPKPALGERDEPPKPALGERDEPPKPAQGGAGRVGGLNAMWRRRRVGRLVPLVAAAVVLVLFTGCNSAGPRPSAARKETRATSAPATSAPPTSAPPTVPATSAPTAPSPPTTAPPTTVPPPSAPATPPTGSLSVLVEPEAGMTPIYSAIEGAQHTIDMTMYELSDSTVVQLLVAAQNRGVQVRVLLDEDYSGGSVNGADYQSLSGSGVPVRWADPSVIFHQKTITIDDATSFIMTGNLTPQYYATTRDFIVVDTQPADVAAIESGFNSDWGGGAPGPAPGGVDLVWSPGSESQLVSLIDSAETSIMVENEEMDSTAIEGALESDAQRGVDVVVVMTADSTWDAAFSQLEAAGVHIVTYPDNDTALYIHAKAIVVDSTTAFVGSENFSTASTDYNRELGLVTTNPSVVEAVSFTLATDATGNASP